MMKQYLEALGYGLIGTIRVGAGALLLALACFTVVHFGREWNAFRRFALAALVVFAVTTIAYFDSAFRCVDGYQDTDDWGRPTFVCRQYVATRDPRAHETSLWAGAVVAGALATWTAFSRFEDRLKRLEKDSTKVGQP